ncbi:MAG: prephenate dehydrogenase [Bordetella sp.]
MINRLLLVGCGLMGGSVAAALRAHLPSVQVWVVDPTFGEQAVEQGLASRCFSSMQTMLDQAEPSIPQGLLFATPAHVTGKLLINLSHTLEEPYAQSLQWISELGSVKAPVRKALHSIESSPGFHALQALFVPSHPMAGSEQSGLSAADPNLLQGARVLISRLSDNQPEAVDSLELFFSSLGGLPIALPLEEHDELLAALSHLPHLLAYGLASMLASGPYAAAAQSLHGGGLRDTTRIAGSSAELWSGIFLENRQALLALMTQYQLSLSELVHALEARDTQALQQSLERASQWRRQFS